MKIFYVTFEERRKICGQTNKITVSVVAPDMLTVLENISVIKTECEDNYLWGKTMEVELVDVSLASDAIVLK